MAQLENKRVRGLAPKKKKSLNDQFADFKREGKLPDLGQSVGTKQDDRAINNIHLPGGKASASGGFDGQYDTRNYVVNNTLSPEQRHEFNRSVLSKSDGTSSPVTRLDHTMKLQEARVRAHSADKKIVGQKEKRGEKKEEETSKKTGKPSRKRRTQDNSHELEDLIAKVNQFRKRFLKFAGRNKTEPEQKKEPEKQTRVKAALAHLSDPSFKDLQRG